MGNAQTNTTYANGTTLTSNAFSDAGIATFLQPLVLDMLGQPIVNTSDRVRISWPSEGAPFQSTTQDVCYLRCTPFDIPYDKIRDEGPIATVGTFNTVQANYTRGWSIHFVAYGPNAVDNLREVRDALYNQYFTDQLANGTLFPVSNFPQVIRMPELIDGQWFERSDLEVTMYEFVTETIGQQTVASVEVIVEEATGIVADITVAGG